MRRSAVVLLVVLVVFVLSFAIAKWGTTFLLWVFGAIALWFLLSIKIVGPAEMAVRVHFSVPIGMATSGFRLVPFLPACYLKRYPTRLYNLVFPSRQIVSQAGDHKGIIYGSQVLTVDSVVYLRFPQGKNLITILQSQIPIEDKDLQDWTEEAVVGALRVVLGQMTWKEVTEDIGSVIRSANDVFTDSDGALMRAGFVPNDIRLTIKEIRLPRELEASLPEVDRARLRAEASQAVARERATETVGMVLESLAQARGKTLAEIQALVNGDHKLQQEFLSMAQEAWQRAQAIDGQSFVDIRVGGAEGLETTLLNLLAAWKRMPTGATGGAGEKKVVISKEEQKRRDEEALKKAIP